MKDQSTDRSRSINNYWAQRDNIKIEQEGFRVLIRSITALSVFECPKSHYYYIYNLYIEFMSLLKMIYL